MYLDAASSPKSARPPCCVLKIGGSLLNLPDLAARIESILAQRRDSRAVLLAGGGEVVDVVRGWHSRFLLSEAESHRLAMGALRATAELLERLIPKAQRCQRVGEVRAVWMSGGVPVIVPDAWFDASPGWFEGEPRLATGLLPQSWEVTSDVLAGCVAVDLQAAELLLVKSVPSPVNGGLTDAVRDGAVDCHLPRLAGLLPQISWVNARATPPELTALKVSAAENRESPGSQSSAPPPARSA